MPKERFVSISNFPEQAPDAKVFKFKLLFVDPDFKEQVSQLFYTQRRRECRFWVRQIHRLFNMGGQQKHQGKPPTAASAAAPGFAGKAKRATSEESK